MAEASAFERAVTGYFRAPDAGRLVSLFAAEPVTERWRAETVLTLPVFLALMIDGAPEAARPLVDAARGEPVKVEVVAQALNYSNLPDRRRLMETLVGESAAASMDESGADFKALEPTHPVHVDMLWAAFFASGDADYVDRIVHLLAGWLPEPQLEGLLGVAARDEAAARAAMAGVLANAAELSLAVNLRDVPAIKAALASFAERRQGMGSARAARILAVAA